MTEFSPTSSFTRVRRHILMVSCGSYLVYVALLSWLSDAPALTALGGLRLLTWLWSEVSMDIWCGNLQ